MTDRDEMSEARAEALRRAEPRYADTLPTEAIRSAEILTIGTELLMGQITNTNASWLARQLADLGISSFWQMVVGDNLRRATEALELALSRSDLVILTGGLGPTEDDISMAVASTATGVALEESAAEWEKIASFFAKRGRKVGANNRKQALLPSPGMILPNANGTAPGAILSAEIAGRTRYVVLLPGPPRENRPMFDDYVRAFLVRRSEHELRSVFIRLVGIGESEVERQIYDLVHERSEPSVASYCSTGEVYLRVTQRLQRDQVDDGALTAVVDEIRARLGAHIYEVGPRSLVQVTSDALRSAGRNCATAESCTGGLIASALVSEDGASMVFRGGIVAYDNEIKRDVLGVGEEILAAHGAVSEQTAIAMAEGVRARLGSDYGLSVTGIAGPSGGSPDKPVGTVWFGLAGPQGSQALLVQLSGSRDKIRETAVVHALTLLNRQVNADQALLEDGAQ